MNHRAFSAICLLGALAVPLVPGCIVVDDLDLVEEHHESQSDLAASAEDAPFSWKLQVVPPGAMDIRSCSDIDTGELWVFYRSAREVPPLPASECRPIRPDELVPPRIRRTQRLGWWREAYSSLSSATTRPRHYRCVRKIEYGSGRIESVVGFMALPADSDRVLYWEALPQQREGEAER